MPEADALHDRVHALLVAVSAISAEMDLPKRDADHRALCR